MRSALILFCLWHMLAVAVYAVPDPATDAVAGWIRSTITPVIRPYIFATSQWQQWNLFSPEPQRRVTEYHLVEDSLQQPGNSRIHLVLSPSTYRWWRRTDEIAMFSKWEDQSEEMIKPLLERYVASYCVPLGIPVTSSLQLTGRYAYLPVATRKDLSHQSPQLAWEPFSSAVVSCEDPELVSPVFYP